MAVTTLRMAPGAEIEIHDAVIAPDTLAAIFDARGRLVAVQAECERVRKQAVLDAEAAREQGYRAGFAEGREAARQQFAVAAMAAQQVARAHDQHVIRAISRGVRAVLGLLPEDTVVRALARRAVETMPVFGHLSLRVRPADVAAAQAGVADCAAAGVSIQVVQDATLEPCSCRLESEAGWVDASLDSQLVALDAALSELASHREEADGVDGQERVDAA